MAEEAAIGPTDAATEVHIPYVPDSSRFRVVCRRADYVASAIARAVEDCDAHLLNLNVLPDPAGPDMLAVDVRVDRRNTESVIRSLARYGYSAEGYALTPAGTDPAADEERRRIDEFLHYIDI